MSAAATPQNANAKGRLTQVIGAVVDVEFEGALPAILNALETSGLQDGEIGEHDDTCAQACGCGLKLQNG